MPRARAASQYGSWGHNKVRKHSLPSFVPSQRPASGVLRPRVNPMDSQPSHTSFPLRGRYPGEKTDVASEGHYAIHLYYQPSLRSIDKLFILCSTDTMLIRFPDCNRIPETAELERGRLILAHTFEGRRAPLVSPVWQCITVGGVAEEAIHLTTRTPKVKMVRVLWSCLMTHSGDLKPPTRSHLLKDRSSATGD